MDPFDLTASYYGVKIPETAAQATQQATGAPLANNVAGATYNPVINQGSGLSSMFGSLGSAGGVLQGLGALANAYTGYKNYQLAQDQFDYNKALGNANLYNAATQANNAMTNATNVGNALAGSTMSDADKSASLAGLSSKYLKTTI